MYMSVEETKTYEMSKLARKGLSQWLSPIKWDVFATATFPRPISPSSALATFADYFINNVEKGLHGPVACLYGMELATKSYQRIRAHIHFVMKGSKFLSGRLLSDAWLMLVKGSTKSNNGIFDVKKYDPNLPGVDYLLKHADEHFGTWDEHNIKFVLPEARELSGSTPRERRLLKLFANS